MELTTVREIFRDREKYLNKEIQVGGWVRSNRDSKAFGFLVLHDGTFFETLQIVYHDTMANFQELTKINVGAAVIVKGTLVPTPEAKQPFEIQAEEISIEGLWRISLRPETDYFYIICLFLRFVKGLFKACFAVLVFGDKEALKICRLINK